MEISERGVHLLEEFEGRTHHAFRDQGGTLTIGIGHTGPDVHANSVWTDEQCEKQLKIDLREREEQLTKYLGDCPTTQLQFDAMLVLGYNIGMGALHGSEVLQYHKEKRYKSASLAFMNWTKVHNVTIGGLVRRRKAERALYDEGTPNELTSTHSFG